MVGGENKRTRGGQLTNGERWKCRHLGGMDDEKKVCRKGTLVGNNRQRTGTTKMARRREVWLFFTTACFFFLYFFAPTDFGKRMDDRLEGREVSKESNKVVVGGTNEDSRLVSLSSVVWEVCILYFIWSRTP